MLEFQNYGQMRDINANQDELLIIENLLKICPELTICRKSDSYITAVLGETDVARFKFTPRAKWINFPYTAGKVKLASASDLSNMKDVVLEAVRSAEEINNY